LVHLGPSDGEFKKLLADATILVTGGTGSFGRHITNELLKYPVREVRIFSRDEDLQHQMAREFSDKRLRFVIGDVRDFDRVLESMKNVNYVFHAAALKQVPDCELHPFEAVKTNVVGAHNIKTAALRSRVKKVVAISTDKAVKPVNAMGMTKALQEKVLLSPELADSGDTAFSIVRYGNVIGSRGSVIPLFSERVRKKQDLGVTSFEMTRFWLTLNDAVALVLKATCDSEGGETYVKKSPACLIRDLAEVMAGDEVRVLETGVRPGEKIHEVLVQEAEARRSTEDDEYFVIHSPGETLPRSVRAAKPLEYTSEKARRLSKAEIAQMLLDAGLFPTR
jgi:UDP-N-acetylglucosamine 4,6-dehydratase/5-epimerase